MSQMSLHSLCIHKDLVGGTKLCVVLEKHCARNLLSTDVKKRESERGELVCQRDGCLHMTDFLLLVLLL